MRVAWLCLCSAVAMGLLVATGFSAAWGEAQAQETVPRIKPISPIGDVKSGEKIYLDRCWACHGVSGDGRGPAAGGMVPPPTDFTAPGALKQRSEHDLLDAVLKGKPGTAMYPQSVPPQSAVDVLAFVRGFSLKTLSDGKSLLEALARGDREAGRTLYNNRCWPCHGSTGRGDGPAAPTLRPPPKDFTDPENLPSFTGGYLYGVLSRGVPGTAMGAQALSEKEKWDVIAYVRSLVRVGGGEADEDDHSPPSGDPRSGKEIYDKRCWACHGAAGAGDGPAASAMIPPATRFTDFEAMEKKTPQEWFNAIQSGVPGTAMYPQRLTEPQAWDLVAYLRTLGRKKPGTR